MALDAQRVVVFLLLFQALFWVAHLISKSVFADKYVKLSPCDRNQWCQFVCSFVKGTVISVLCFPIAFRNAEQCWAADSLDGAVNGTDMELPLYVFLGYALSDLLSIVAYFRRGKGDTAMVVHHVATASIWSYLLAIDFGYTFANVACLVECTTPLLAVRWFMASSLKTHPFYVFNGLMILIGWWALRIGVYVGFFGWKVHVIYISSFQPSRDLPVFVAWLVGAVLQILWWVPPSR